MYLFFTDVRCVDEMMFVLEWIEWQILCTKGVMMQTLAVLALVIGVAMLLRQLGPPTRHYPEEKKSTPQSPEADIPPPDTPIIS